MKKLYEFKVQKPVVNKVEEKTEEGVLIREVEGTEEKSAFIKLPQRKDTDQLKIIYSAELANA